MIVFFQPGYAHYRDELFAELAKRHDILFIYASSRNTYPDESLPKSTKYLFMDEYFTFSWFGLILFLIKNKPEIIITSGLFSWFTIITMIYAGTFQKKYILWLEDWRYCVPKEISFKNLIRRTRRLIGKLTITKANRLIVSGSASYNYSVSFGIPQDRVLMVFQCAQDIRLRCDIRSGNSFREKKTFLYLSRVISWKGLDVLIHAFAKLEIDHDVELIVAGDGPFKNYCEMLCRQLNVKNIEFIDAVSPAFIHEVYQKADYFVLPSRFEGNAYEGWGLVINEALSMGLPVISTDAVGAAFDLIMNGKNGFTVENNNVDALYCAMKNILKLDYEALSKTSRQIFDNINNYQVMADGFSSALTSLR